MMSAMVKTGSNELDDEFDCVLRDHQNYVNNYLVVS